MKKVILVMAVLALLVCLGVSAQATTDHFNAGGRYTSGRTPSEWDGPYTNYTFTVVDQGGDVWYGANGLAGANTLGDRSDITPGNYTNMVYTISGTIDSLNLINQTSADLGSWFTTGIMSYDEGFNYDSSWYNSGMNNKPGVYLGFGKSDDGYFGFLKNGGTGNTGAQLSTSAFNPTGATFVAQFNTQTGVSGLSINGAPMQTVTLDTSMLDNAVGIAQLYHGSNFAYSATNQSSIYLTNLNVSTAAVPEPMSIMLGIMGLGSVAGFKRLRRS